MKIEPDLRLALACEQQTHFRSSLNRRERSDDRKCVCCSQAKVSPSVVKTLTAKGTVLAPEKRDFTVLLTKFAFIVTFEEFLVLNS